MLNRIVLIGRLGADPDHKVSESGVSVAKFTLAVDRGLSQKDKDAGKQATDWFNVTAFRSTADFCANYLGKGRLVAVDGKMQIDQRETQDGQKRTYPNVIADNIRPLDRAPEGNGAGEDNQAEHRRHLQGRGGAWNPGPPLPTRGTQERRPPAGVAAFDDIDDLADPFSE